MTPTEHEMTVATDAAARAYFVEATRDAGPPFREFDDLGAMDQWALRQQCLPLAIAAISALPDRRAAAWDEGLAAAGSQPMPDNPYRQDPT